MPSLSINRNSSVISHLGLKFPVLAVGLEVEFLHGSLGWEFAAGMPSAYLSQTLISYVRSPIQGLFGHTMEPNSSIKGLGRQVSVREEKVYPEFSSSVSC